MDLSTLTVGQPERMVAGLSGRFRECRSVEDAANLLCGETYEHCRSGPDHERSLVLARIFLSLPYRALDPETARHVKRSNVKPDDYFFVLIGTHGRAADWCDRRKSARHRAVPIAREGPQENRMFQTAFSQIGFDVGLIGGSAGGIWTPRDLFMVREARGQPALPAQEEFIKPMGIQSVVGCGATLPDGAISLFVAFSRHPVTESGAMPLLAFLPAFWHAVQALYRRRAIFS